MNGEELSVFTAVRFYHLLVSSDDSLNNGIANPVVNKFVICAANEKLVLKESETLKHRNKLLKVLRQTEVKNVAFLKIK